MTGRQAQPTPPQNLEAEESVLGAMMLSPGAIVSVSDVLDASDFYRESHATIYRAALGLHAKGEPVDSITLASALERAGDLERAGGKQRIHELAALVPATANAAHYARLVRDAAERRRQDALGLRIRNAAKNGGVSADPELTAELRELLEESGPARAGDFAGRTVDGLTFLSAEATETVANWGDGESVLWAVGEPLAIVGPDGVGKTSLGQQLALARLNGGELLGLQVAPAKGKVLYIAADRPRQAARSMRRMLGRIDEELLRDRLVVHRGPLPFDIVTEPAPTLRQFAQSLGASDVIIDSLKDLASGLSKDDIGSTVNRAFQEVCAAGLELLALHHQRKQQQGAGPPRKLEDVFGSRWLTAGMGSVVMLWGEPGDLVVAFQHLKQPIEEVGPFNLLHDHVRGRTTVHEHASLEQLLANAAAGLTVKDAARLLFGKDDPSKNDIEKTRRKLQALIGRNHAERRDDPDGTARYFDRQPPVALAANTAAASEKPSVTPVTPSVTPSRDLTAPHGLAQPSGTQGVTPLTNEGGLTPPYKEHRGREAQSATVKGARPARFNPRPIIGDELYPLLLANATKAEKHLTKPEAEQQLALHKTVELALAWSATRSRPTSTLEELLGEEAA